MGKVSSDFAAKMAAAEEAAAASEAAHREALASAQDILDSFATLQGDLKTLMKEMKATSEQCDPGLERSASKMFAAVKAFLTRLKPKKKSLKKTALKKAKSEKGAVPKSMGKKVAFLMA